MSDPLEELKRIAEKEAAEARDKAESESRDKQREREKEAAAARAKVENARRAPGSFSSMRFLGVGFAGLMLLTIIGSIWLEDDFAATRWFWPAVPVWLLAMLVLIIDGLTWRARLPFKLIGYETIEGTDKTGSNHAPYIRFEVRITLQGHASHEAVAHTLEILGKRVNAMMFADKEADFGGAKVWRVSVRNSVGGQASRAIYTGRVIEKWLRKEVRLLHKAVPVSQVTVEATYSGDSYWVSSSD
ncbi:MAG: hypothetical protein JNM17_27960 [Archangium sp.]|nr:hypothetical protein [Archangium sp.]